MPGMEIKGLDLRYSQC